MFRILAIAVMFAGTTSVALAEEVYRWTDAQGRVQYSDRWVPGSVLVKTTNTRPTPETPAPPAAADEDAGSSGDEDPSGTSDDEEPSDPSDQADNQRTVQQDVAKVRQQQCKEATERYEKAIQARRIYKEGANGERIYSSDTEADAYRARALSDKKALCGA